MITFPSCSRRLLAFLTLSAFLSRPCFGCSQMKKFTRWVDDFMNMCEDTAYEGTPRHGQKPLDWFADCEWVTCECLWQSLKVPVATNEVTACYEQGMKDGKITKEHQQFTLAILEKCRRRTEVLSEPCAVCDQYSAERPECYNGTAIRTPSPASMRGGGESALGGSEPTKQPAEATAGASRRWSMVGMSMVMSLPLLGFLAIIIPGHDVVLLAAFSLAAPGLLLTT